MPDYIKEIRLNEASDDELVKISDELGLALSLDEMRRIQSYFKDRNRNPRDIELQSIAQNWSEHC